MKYFAILFLAVAAAHPVDKPNSLEFTTIASGLCSPRGIEIIGNSIYVAEAGSAGTENCQETDRGVMCGGSTGAVTKITLPSGAKNTLISNLPSFGGREGATAFDVTGPHKVIPFQNDLIVLMGGPVSNILLATSTTEGYSVAEVANIGAAEAELNPDGAQIDSNPFSAIMTPSGLFVADAAANAIWKVTEEGQITPATTFSKLTHQCIPPGFGPCTEIPPNLPAGNGPFFCCGFFGPEVSTYPTEFVPTGTATRPGNPNEIYISSLTGIFWNSNDAVIAKIDIQNPEAGYTVVASGFNSIISITFDGPNDLYVLEQNFFGAGTFTGLNRLTQVNLATGAKTEIQTNLNGSTSIYASAGWLYASDSANMSVDGSCPGTLVRAQLAPPPPPAPPGMGMGMGMGM